jgi:very-short-patch-repair endonuclease
LVSPSRRGTGHGTVPLVNGDLRKFLADHDGVVTWSAACAAVPSHVVEHASRTGQLRLVFPGVLAAPDHDDDHVRRRAALLCAGPQSALSHLTALAVWDLAPCAPGAAVHVVTPPDRRIRIAGIVAHRRDGFLREPPHAVWRRDLPVTRLERTLVDSWPLLVADAQRAPVIRAVSGRMTTPDRLAATLAETPNLPARADLAHLIHLLAAGCRSPLELWGYQEVFTGLGFEQLRWQVPIRIGRRTVYLDAFDEDSATNFELDGARWHDLPRDRDRDQRRDALLATVGIHPVRFSHQRLTREVRQVRAESLAIMAARRARRQLQIG